MTSEQQARVTLILRGPYSFKEGDIQSEQYVGDREIHEWIRQQMSSVAPYKQVRLTIEVFD